MKINYRKMLLKITVIVAVTLTIIFLIGPNIPRMVKPLSLYEYSKLKTLLVTRGTQVSTVKLESSDRRFASGTLIKNGQTEIVITVGHFFHKSHKNTFYHFQMDGKTFPIEKVFSHPQTGAFGGKDIAFCVVGKSRKIYNYSDFGGEDTEFHNVYVNPYGPLDTLFLRHNKMISILGTATDGPGEPVYLINYESINGESGSGLLSNGRFFVIVGNLPKVGKLEEFSAIGLNQGSITIVTEL